MMEILICDDIKIQADLLKSAIQTHYGNARSINFHIYDNGSAVVDHYQKRPHEYDVIFLDIVMSGLNGIDTAKMIREVDLTVPIVFFSGTHEYAQQGYEVDAISYLIKPIQTKALAKLLDKIDMRSMYQNQPILVVKSEGVFYRIPMRFIPYIERVGAKTAIHRYHDQPILCDYSIKELQKQLLDRSDFIICFQNNYINLRYVVSIDKAMQTIHLSDGTSAPISRHRVRPILDAFAERWEA